MKPRTTTVTILAMLSGALALADDFRTTDGKEYKDATVTHVEPNGIVVKTKSGISKLYFTELPKEVQDRFGYGLPQTRYTALQQREYDVLRQIGDAEQAKAYLDSGGRRTKKHEQHRQQELSDMSMLAAQLPALNSELVSVRAAKADLQKQLQNPSSSQPPSSPTPSRTKAAHKQKKKHHK